MNQPTVSILIPTYNYARFLPEAIESALSQDFSDFELIIADDASTDNTVEVCQRYAAQDSRIRFVRHEYNLGMVENWNWCLRAARGKYIKYLLADDKFNQPDALRCLVEMLENHPEVSLVVSSRQLINELSRCGLITNPLGPSDRIFNGVAVIKRCLKTDVNLIGEPTAALFRKGDAGREFDTEYRQLVDLEMWLYLLQRGCLAYFAKPLCCFRLHPLQQTEVNKSLGIHHRESARLLHDFYLQRVVGRQALFRRIFRLKRSGGPECKELVDGFKAEFGRVGYAGHYLLYKVARRGGQIRRSLIKRLSRG